MKMPAEMDASPSQCLTLALGRHRARVAPAAGGRVLEWSSDLPGGPRDWLAPVHAQHWPAHEWPKGGIFPLAPFSNRIRDARMAWAGEQLQLQPLPGQPHALHGQAQRMAWEVLDAQPHQAVLGLHHPAGLDGWPWAWRLQQVITLTEHGLDIELSLQNQDCRPSPVGLGLHPYFTADSVRAVATRDWAHKQELALFPRPNRQDRWRRTPETWTAFLSGWTGAASIAWAEGPGIEMTTRGPLNHLVLHCNAGRYLCVEPATHVCDAANLAAAGVPGTGLMTLAPQETLTIGMTLSVRL